MCRTLSWVKLLESFLICEKTEKFAISDELLNDLTKFRCYDKIEGSIIKWISFEKEERKITSFLNDVVMTKHTQKVMKIWHFCFVYRCQR